MRKRWAWMAVLLAATGCQRTLIQGLEEREANELVTVLVGRGVEANKVLEKGRPPTWGLKVAGGHLSRAAQVLTELGLPRPRPATSRDVLAERSWLTSAEEQRARHLMGLSGDLSTTLQAVDGVVDARVHLAVPAPPRPGQVAAPAKAAAFLRVHASSAARVRSKEQQLAELIAGSVERLQAENVRVVFDEVSRSALEPADEGQVRVLRGLVVALGGVVALLSTGLAAALWYRRNNPDLVVTEAPTPSPEPQRTT